MYLTELDNQAQHAHAALDGLSDSLEQQMVQYASVVFATLCVYGREKLREAIKKRTVDVLVVDEAAQSVEAETLIALGLEPTHCVLVGDVMQLPATVVSPAAVAKGFRRSMMWRLQRDCRQPATLLRTQYRMHESIQQWPSARWAPRPCVFAAVR
jgi:superfamily I DNA and/or RNA helicase